MIKRIAHICISAKNLDKSEQFYCGILGMKKKFDFIRDGNVFGFYIEAGPMNFIEFFRADAVPAEKPLITHLCLEVDSIDAVGSAVKSKGWQITDKIMGADKSWQAWVTDPDGVRIEFHEYTNESCQFTGRECVLS